jgi:hypothetical protein
VQLCVTISIDLKEFIRAKRGFVSDGRGQGFGFSDRRLMMLVRSLINPERNELQLFRSCCIL